MKTKTSFKKEGIKAEKTAAEYLKSEGYKILALNARAGMQEIDIVCEDDLYCVFVEVKYTGTLVGLNGFTARPSVRVDRDKRNRLIKGVKRYISENGVSLPPRIDVIEIYGNPESVIDTAQEEDVKFASLKNGVRLVHIRNAVTDDMRTPEKKRRQL